MEKLFIILQIMVITRLTILLYQRNFTTANLNKINAV